ncbi:MAG: hypothetical protein ACJA0U_000016 [Salibacteraceae bacterium]|jgi:hypothetical protein
MNKAMVAFLSLSREGDFFIFFKIELVSKFEKTKNMQANYNIRACNF